MRRLSALLVLCAVSSCASYTALAPSDREQIERDLSAKEADQYLKLSFYVAPFFGDASKKLLSDVPSEEVRLLNDTKGQPIDPGPVEKIFPAGKRVKVLKVEFPTSWAVTERIVYTPRTQPWVYLAVEGETNDLPYILVLRAGIKTREEFYGELQRYLVHDDPKAKLDGFSPGVREAIAKKEAVAEMPAEALEMAWGYPETKKVTFEEQVRKEEWSWPGKKRSATVVDGRVSEVKDSK
ncbi:MAG: hypothetical protein ACJ790_00050 [Myxococcaceae bacterium]